MEKNTPVRKPHTSTADLLTWKETPLPDPAGESGTPSARSKSHQPSKVGEVLFGGQLTAEEAESLLKRKPCSGAKLKEITGSGIFEPDSEKDAADGNPSTPNKTGLRIYQQTVNAMSQISFSADGPVSPKKPSTLTEVAKQRELSGTLESDADAKLMKQSSDAKTRELSGHDIFGPPETPKTLAERALESKERKDNVETTPRNVHTSVKVSNPAGGQTNFLFSEEENVAKTAKKIYNQKAADLSGNDIFKGDAAPASADKPLSSAKLREMTGSDIFADGKAASRDYLGGVRKPPGGESSIALV